jgi:hypothetical protein
MEWDGIRMGRRFSGGGDATATASSGVSGRPSLAALRGDVILQVLLGHQADFAGHRLSCWVDDVGGGQGRNGAERGLARRLAAQHGIGDVLLGDEALQCCRIDGLEIDADDDDVAVAVRLVQRNQVGQFLAAGAAPGRPVIDDDPFSAVLVERLQAAVEVGEGVAGGVGEGANPRKIAETSPFNQVFMERLFSG